MSDRLHDFALRFVWDDANVVHVSRHAVTPDEAVQVVWNRPADLGAELRNGEMRVTHVGETNLGRILIVIVTTIADDKIRVVTAWPAKDRFRRYFATLKRNGNVGRIEEENLRE